jgi:hypothetical protein
VQLGFDPSQVLTMRLSLPQASYQVATQVLSNAVHLLQIITARSGSLHGRGRRRTVLTTLKNGRVRADAESQRQGRDGGERRVPAQSTGAEANVLQDVVKKGRGHGVGLDGQKWPNVGRNA